MTSSILLKHNSSHHNKARGITNLSFRNRYLLFNPDDLVIRDLDTIQQFAFNSYREIFNRSMQLRTDTILTIYEELFPRKYEAYSKIDESSDYNLILNDDMVIPSTVKSLNFDHSYYTNIERISGLSNSNIKQITLSNDYNKQVQPGVLPQTLEYLMFLEAFNHPIIPGSLPPSIKQLFISNEFTHPLTQPMLPRYLEILDIESFAKPLVPGVFPESLTELSIRLSEESEDSGYLLVQGVLPSNLKYLSFQHLRCNASDLPPSLTYLRLSDQFQMTVECNLNHLTALTTLLYFPIECLELGIPKNVTTLSLTKKSADGSGGDEFLLKRGVLPTTITDLNFLFIRSLRIEEGSIPSSVKKLHLGMYFDQQLKPGCISEGIEYLHLGQIFNSKLQPGDLPNGIKTLFLSDCFSSVLVPDTIPNTVETLHFGYYLVALQPNTLPSSLLSLSFWEYRHTFTFGVIPPNLKRLVVGSVKYSCDFDSNTIPSSIEYLKFRNISGTLQPDYSNLNPMLHRYVNSDGKDY
ncbi:hypothetical protein PPL_03774 [Heterostelium album PN500]|uniref:Uncharacterized protein n=1 Tax=Heterostelium pallidum (strain ATCC 26659 / Pp 5 / PN500) TaxID=670386 RepID=D3B6M4_HETP5|nr:hypothetical protein PPL_03774 [Heterostelium album PN500]EFA82994.1 hypothetical protein PPL_03774 [Heterostelium album PN500]|eukprot:XP_020435111.1 hypothetical protein PPL_03774 [Heterostelium album PN500]